jgi:hypothetical protein
MSSFTEAKLESAIITLLQDEGYEYVSGDSIVRKTSAVFIREDLSRYLSNRYHKDNRSIPARISTSGLKIAIQGYLRGVCGKRLPGRNFSSSSSESLIFYHLKNLTLIWLLPCLAQALHFISPNHQTITHHKSNNRS